jgi:cyclopropane fatty-acyl-phospholipid synthase-like methyltransferase
MQSFYNFLYRRSVAPWDIGPRRELVSLVESGRLTPGKAIDLGSGTASNCIYLARHGFEVTGVDFSQGAVELGTRRAQEAGFSVTFLRDDLTHLQAVSGVFDLLVDYGTLDDLPPNQRDLYMQNVLPLTRPGSKFLLYAFEWTLSWWENAFLKVIPFAAMALEPGEAERRFAPYFEIEKIAGESRLKGWPRGYSVYLMTRKGASQ